VVRLTFSGSGGDSDAVTALVALLLSLLKLVVVMVFVLIWLLAQRLEVAVDGL
jgi:hypothetical protein